MEKVNRNVLIASAIIELDKEEISLDEIINYINKTRMDLLKNNYEVDQIDLQTVLKFLKYYRYLDLYDGKRINVDERKVAKLKKYFLSDIDDKLRIILKKETIYVFPIVDGEFINLYYFVTKNLILENSKSKLYRDVDKDVYVIDLNVLTDIELISAIISSENVKKESLNYDAVSEFVSTYKGLTNKKYKQIENYFSIYNDINKLKKLSKKMLVYYDTAISNAKSKDKVLVNRLKKI